MKKIGLVVEGGGMKCAYNAGVLDAFLDDGITFDYCIGVSGGAGNVASFVAGQRGRNLRFFTDYIHDPQYFGIRSFLKTGDLFGLRYIYGELTNGTGRDPIDYAAILANPAEYKVVVTNAATGKAEYFCKTDMRQDDYRLLMASSAIPIACRPIEIDGKRYFDGGVSDGIPVDRALADGCNKLVVILSKPRSYIRKATGGRLLYRAMLRKYPNTVSAILNRHIVYNATLECVWKLEREGTALVLAPSKQLKVGTYSMDEQVERQLYELGIADYSEKKATLTEFLRR